MVSHSWTLKKPHSHLTLDGGDAHKFIAQSSVSLARICHIICVSVARSRYQSAYTHEVTTYKYLDQDGHGWNDSRRSSNTMNAYTNGSIPRQYFFDTNYFQLLMGLKFGSRDPKLWLIVCFESNYHYQCTLFKS